MSISKDRGLHIVFEGLDGGGKSTHADILTNRLRKEGFVVYNWREALKEEDLDKDMTRIIKDISRITSDPKNTNMAPTTELLIYSARVAQVIDEGILPHLKGGEIVISVRCIPTLYSIFHFIRGLDKGIIDEVTDFIGEDLRTDIVILCDADPDQAWGVVESRDQPKDRRELEGVKHFELMRKGFINLAQEEPEKWRTIRTLENPKEESANEIWKEIKPLLSQKNLKITNS